MKFLHTILLFLLLVVVANGGKIHWDSKGKPQIESSGKPERGCYHMGLAGLLKDNNNSSPCSK